MIEFDELVISEEDKFMVVASDGVWEYLSDNDVSKQAKIFVAESSFTP